MVSQRCCRNALMTGSMIVNPVRVIDAFVDALDLKTLCFEGVDPDWAAFLPSLCSAEALHLRLSQSYPVEPSFRARGEAQFGETVEHPFGTLKMRMGATHFLMKRLPKVATKMALHVLAYNLTRAMNIMGVKPLIAAIRA